MKLWLIHGIVCKHWDYDMPPWQLWHMGLVEGVSWTHSIPINTGINLCRQSQFSLSSFTPGIYQARKHCPVTALLKLQWLGQWHRSTQTAQKHPDRKKKIQRRNPLKYHPVSDSPIFPQYPLVVQLDGKALIYRSFEQQNRCSHRCFLVCIMYIDNCNLQSFMRDTAVEFR